MAISNHERVGKGLEALRSGLAPYVSRELKAHFGKSWWEQGVEPGLPASWEGGRRGAKGADAQFASLDAYALFGVLWNQWNAVFHSKLGHVGRTYVSELRDVRNKWAHQEAFTVEDAHRALDTMTRLLEMSSSPEKDKTALLARDLLRLRYEEETRRELRRGAEVVTATGTPTGLKPWREVATPHPDVASGRYQQAEFAADMAQVLSGEAEAEYQNPQEFFRRTYLTEGLTHLLGLGLKRLTGSGGDPVVELQTNFGGGKTHSLIALYHLVGGQIAAGELPGLEPLLTKASITDLPQAKRAVLVGTKINPATPQRKSDGTTVHTLWGELAHQLGAKKGYALVADADRKGVSPGSDALKRLFEDFGPALVLIDEWVTFVRQLYRVDGLPAGSFDANMTFAQALTEAARRSSQALVVVSLPSSDIEIGGEGGRAALERLRSTVGRIEAVWKPASPEESFEIVRRRLFEPIRDFAARDAICRAFAEMYRDNRGEFPRECGEGDYERRLKGAYPIHPELFDRLYQDWSTLERFQRTRGVLRLMAAVIHNLWERQDKSLLIMPGTVPLDSPPVRYEMTRYLPEGWEAIIDTDIDGPTSRPMALDRDNPNLGRYSACRRVTRTTFFGSAPSVAAQRVRGQGEVRIKLGCVQPGEVPATFGDALRRLGEQLTYLYGDGTRYWFDTHPSVNRLASDRAEQLRPDVVEDEIVRRLRARRDRGDFTAVHVAPDSSADVPDEDAVRLVVLGPGHVHGARLDPSPGRAEAENILNHRGTSPRLCKNMLVFLVADKDRLAELERAVGQHVAWRSIEDEKEQL
ncbi:MAG: Swt1 family HEPN domain-containing protein, partial [Nitrospirales bacterium]